MPRPLVSLAALSLTLVVDAHAADPRPASRQMPGKQVPSTQVPSKRAPARRAVPGKRARRISPAIAAALMAQTVHLQKGYTFRDHRGKPLYVQRGFYIVSSRDSKTVVLRHPTGKVHRLQAYARRHEEALKRPVAVGVPLGRTKARRLDVSLMLRRGTTLHAIGTPGHTTRPRTTRGAPDDAVAKQVAKRKAGTMWVKQPSPTTSVRAGSTTTVTWQHKGTVVGKVNVVLVQKGTTILPIATKAENTGSLSWKVPSGLVSGRYSVLVETLDGAVISAADEFDLRGPAAAPTVSLKITRIEDYEVPGSKLQISILSDASGLHLHSFPRDNDLLVDFTGSAPVAPVDYDYRGWPGSGDEHRADLVVEVPESARSGRLAITMTGARLETDFVVMDATPRITSISRTKAHYKDTIVIRGSGFGPFSKSTDHTSVPNADSVKITEGRIEFKVRKHSVDFYPIVSTWVSSKRRQAQAEHKIDVVPLVDYCLPRRPWPGGKVDMIGDQLGVPATVKIGGIEATIEHPSMLADYAGDGLLVNVPHNAKPGMIEVTNSIGTGGSLKELQVRHPKIENVSTTTVSPGSEFVITGQDLEMDYYYLKPCTEAGAWRHTSDGRVSIQGHKCSIRQDLQVVSKKYGEVRLKVPAAFPKGPAILYLQATRSCCGVDMTVQ